MVENLHRLFFLFSELSGHVQIVSLPDSLDYLVVPEWVGQNTPLIYLLEHNALWPNVIPQQSSHHNQTG